MARIEYKNDQTKNIQEVEGSDGRLNTSSRSDGRRYYNSRDVERCFTVPFDFQDAQSGEFAAYWRNTSSTDDLVISSIGVNAAVASRVKLWFVSGTATGGTTIIPTNLNKSSSKAAEGVAMEGASAATGITGLTGEKLIDFVGVSADCHEEFRLNDSLRLGQNDAIAIEVDETAGGDVFGVIFGFYEVK